MGSAKGREEAISKIMQELCQVWSGSTWEKQQLHVNVHRPTLEGDLNKKIRRMEQDRQNEGKGRKKPRVICAVTPKTREN